MSRGRVSTTSDVAASCARMVLFNEGANRNRGIAMACCAGDPGLEFSGTNAVALAGATRQLLSAVASGDVVAS